MVKLSTDQHEKLLIIIDQIYQAASTPSLWEAFCDDLADYLGVGCISFGYVDFDHDAAQFTISSLLKSHELEQHRIHYKNKDPWLKALNQLPPNKIYEGTDLVSTAELELSEYYQQFWKQFDMPLMHAGLFKKEDRRIGAIAMHSSTEHGRHTEVQVHILDIILKHLSRAMEIYSHLYRAHSERDMAMQALSSQEIGIFIINGLGETTYVNSKAKQIIKSNPLITLQGKKLLLKSNHQAEQVRQYLSDCVADLQDQQHTPRASITMIAEEISSESRLQIQLMPYLADDFHARKMITMPKIMLLIKLLNNAWPYTPEYFSQSYSLTSAESRVAVLLSQGERYQAISEKLSIGKETIKSHARSIYRKTNTTNQTDFAIFISSGLQP